MDQPQCNTNGTINIKCDTGQTQTLPHVVLTVGFKHAVGLHIEMCKNSNQLVRVCYIEFCNHSNHNRKS